MASPNSNYEAYYSKLVTRLQTNFEATRAEVRKEEEKFLGISPAPAITNRSASVDPRASETARATARVGASASSAPLAVNEAFFYPLENGRDHHTEKFHLTYDPSIPVPVLRRGQSFFMALKTPGRPFDAGKVRLTLTFNFGPSPSPLLGTSVVLKVEKRDTLGGGGGGGWAGRISASDKNALSIEIKSSPDSCVGIWNCVVETRLASAGSNNTTSPAPAPTLVYKCQDDIYMLFNPWEPSDTTYMPNIDRLNEYILEEKGKVWFGPKNNARGRHWAFGQFEISVLPLVVILLEKSGLAITARSNPILVSRSLSKMVNSNDDNGILVGRWDTKYGDGAPPSSWTGSVPIIESYLKTLKPVKYGQCWVFASVLCTVCRAIGIPCRVVTNYVSAHDANASLTIDIYYNAQNEESDFDPHNPSGGKDSIWNFHVWNDVWMARPDLPKGYGGWQAIDSTPQERSDGNFQCGPASLEAIKKGQVGFAYDVPFVLSEVNADLIHWKKDDSPGNAFGFARLSCDNYRIGKMILTKKPNVFDGAGDTDRDDIINEYKMKEGSRAERLALLHAVRGSSVAPQYFEMPVNPIVDVEFSLVAHASKGQGRAVAVVLGQPFSVVVRMKNNSDAVRTVQANLCSESVYYTGAKATFLKKASGKVAVLPGKTEDIRMTVSGADYLSKLVEYGIVKVSAICSVDETKQNWYAEDDLEVKKPSLDIQPGPNWKMNQPATLKYSFKNPLGTPLSNCVISFEGPGFTRFGTIKLPPHVTGMADLEKTAPELTQE